MAEDDKEIRGDQAERLVPSGQDVLDNLSSYSSASLSSKGVQRSCSINICRTSGFI